MTNLRTYFLCAVTITLIVALNGCRELTANRTQQVEAISTETNSRTVEDGGTGPYTAVMVSDSTLDTHTIFRPKDLSVFGKKNKLPIIAWGNGACANSPSGHLNFLSEVASHGFVVLAIGPMPQAGGQRGGGGMMGGGMMGGGRRGGAGGGTPDNSQINMAEYGMPGGMSGGMTGGGMPGGMGGGMMGRGGARGGGGMMSSTQSSQLIDAINWAIAQDSNETSIYYNKIDTTKVCVAGMSCGGLQAYEVSNDPRVSTTMICNSGLITGGGGMGGMMPSIPKESLNDLHAPILYLLGGESDMAYANGSDDFNRIEKLPVFLASMDVGHGGTYMQPHGGEFAKVATAWLQWLLKGDKEAGKMFTGEPCGLSGSTAWQEVKKKNIP